jgi:hypothetical protein
MRLSLLALVLFCVLSGCGSEVSRSDLGVVVFETPKVAGADEPYAMPKLGPPLEKDENSPHRPF